MTTHDTSFNRVGSDTTLSGAASAPRTEMSLVEPRER